MNTKPSEEEDTWIDKMQGYLKWKVNGPEFHNPYAPRISDAQLNRMVASSTYLRENIELRCTCDGYEVLLLKNLEKPRVRCDHPCLNVLTRRQIIDAIGRYGIQDFLESELGKIRRDLVEEIERRKKDKNRKPDPGSRTLREIKEARKEADAAAASVQANSATEEDHRQQFRSLLK